MFFSSNMFVPAPQIIQIREDYYKKEKPLTNCNQSKIKEIIISFDTNNKYGLEGINGFSVGADDPNAVKGIRVNN